MLVNIIIMLEYHCSCYPADFTSQDTATDKITAGVWVIDEELYYTNQSSLILGVGQITGFVMCTFLKEHSAYLSY